MHAKRGNFCIFLLKIAEKEGENRPGVLGGGTASEMRIFTAASPGDPLDLLFGASSLPISRSVTALSAEFTQFPAVFGENREENAAK